MFRVCTGALTIAFEDSPVSLSHIQPPEGVASYDCPVPGGFAVLERLVWLLPLVIRFYSLQKGVRERPWPF